ncbi:SH3 domain-containing protein [Sphingobacterium faecale]|uniref:SH3 domain-containing protein n=1 Tax=Sphingobacterium faecale TaxID=2803775 RepID=A0ABS1R7N6_9SPHI|nr:SH3 domain-containing protein [Sphingobacterium faecale]MBL1410229.1 SH3 domain-containing protein [Sphingobacterium faecale]
MITCVLAVFLGNAQTKEWRPVYTSKWDHLLSSPDNKNSILGVLCTEASITVLDSTRTHYKIRVSNGDVGYIAKQPLDTRMFSKRSAGEPAQYFYRGPEGQQGPHLYVQVAELRVRNQPSTEGKIVRKARLNEHTSLDYYPLYNDGWVYIGDHFHEQPEYIQAKYLGMELTYAELLKAYLKVKDKDITEELNAASRLREIGWSSNKADLLQALRYYKESWERSGQTNPKVDIEFELLLASKLQNLDYEAYEMEMRKLSMYYLIQGRRLWDGKIAEREAADLNLKKVKDIPDSPECGWEPLFFYRSADLILAFEENYPAKNKMVGSVYSMNFAEQHAVVLGKEIIDGSYSERAFVTKFGHLLTVDWAASPHYYRIANGDAGFFAITFKNGVPVAFESVYYC